MAKPFDLLALVSAWGRENGVELTDPRFAALYAGSMHSALSVALKDEALLHGLRVERMFEALVISLGKVQMLKAEDNGRVHGTGNLRAPDFRVVLADGEQWLIETKNVYARNPSGQSCRLSADYVRSLTDYSALVGTPLRLAIHWARWGLWTLVSPSRFIAADGSVKITMEAALCVSEMGRLGDVTIATSPPLRLVLDADPARPATLGEGCAKFTVARARLYSQDRELSDPDEQQLALLLIRFGEWEMTGPEVVFQGSRLVGVEYRSQPIQRDNPDEPFEMAGKASRIFSRYFAEQTVKHGSVVKLSAEAKPDWFSLLTRPHRRGRPLPLWLFRLTPAPDA